MNKKINCIQHVANCHAGGRNPAQQIETGRYQSSNPLSYGTGLLVPINNLPQQNNN